jgi:hypothetical protein
MLFDPPGAVDTPNEDMAREFIFVEELELNFEVTPEELLLPVRWLFQLFSFFILCLFIS